MTVEFSVFSIAEVFNVILVSGRHVVPGDPAVVVTSCFRF